MLGAKHNLITDTHDIEFVEIFNKFFILKFDTVHFNNELIDDLVDTAKYNDYYLLFNSAIINKKKDGEGAGKDRAIQEIVVYDKNKDEYYNIEEMSESTLFLSSEMNTIFKKFELKSDDDIVMIPFSYFVDEVDSSIPLFEIEFKNNDLIEPLKKLDSIINTKQIAKFESFKDIIDITMPLFSKAGINMPQIHMEVIISRLTRSLDMGQVDWNDPEVKYTMVPYDTAILTNPSPVTSIIHIEAKKQLRGAYNFYKKKGSSIYDTIIKS